ncbi:MULTISPECIES: ribokinase [Pectobacterium]|uniref:Ribokinase n=1 Tax=Pectobacterium punjabense TaxID=2108399 RepID=A0ABX6L6S8_9GAMM|nr:MULTISPECIES: ribokinase [Pectobacterium]GKW11463.1 ribokinase [Pectobacterium carotovorum subsp. carotovorum]MBN3135033.1 ribokinase [Pectobacterium punjabense]MBS4431318.1 ribokinase [Pectobacterium punjabense]MBT9182948.1 ribokinase [Pectobacterium punjabense]MCE5381537.1 ribokinase [Pectobacterium punjabense]
MFLEERRNQILAYLAKHERASVDYLATAFAVSKETIRSDLNQLARLNLIQRCYGGAMIVRRLLQSELIAPSGENFEVLLKRLEKQNRHQTSKQKGNSMNGKVCILGSFNVDIVAKVMRFPKGGESIMAQGSAIGPGGKGANQAMAASRAGAQVYFIAKVGTDQFSQFAYDHFTASDIHSFKLYQSDSEPTGNAIIYVSQQNGENMIAIHPGANQTITDDEVAAIASELTTSDVLLVQLENNFSATLNAIKLAHTLGKKVILNPAPYSSEILPYLDYLDVITPNETEASLLSGIDIHDVDDAKEAALKIAAMGAKRVIITMGSRGALLLDGKQFQHIPAFPALGVDTTGAGDAFNGAFAAALANGQNLVQAATYASAFASLAVEREGASNMPEHQQVIARLSQR